MIFKKLVYLSANQLFTKMIINKENNHTIIDLKKTLTGLSDINNDLNILLSWNANSFSHTSKDEPVYSNSTMPERLIVVIYKH